ncbi:helix-turn-helix transcriptional regulator [Lactobacillus sp. Marseille-P7033]|nr:helix-turn-helix transcriptional regulator [Lactobacillus sp. Marseille-P7033]NGC78772.1 helix-turn-helix transcriptional regulator [Limosilactobacillus reuteri]
MVESIVNILKANNITVSFVAQESGLDIAQVSAALKSPVATWSIQILNAFADALAERPGELLDQLQDLPFQLQTDDDQLMIQRVRFSNRSSYQQVRFAVESNVLEGWKPTAKEIRLLKEAAETPDTEMQTEIKRLFGDKNDR